MTGAGSPRSTAGVRLCTARTLPAMRVRQKEATVREHRPVPAAAGDRESMPGGHKFPAAPAPARAGRSPLLPHCNTSGEGIIASCETSG
jgi:hypothetical protein